MEQSMEASPFILGPGLGDAALVSQTVDLPGLLYGCSPEANMSCMFFHGF